MSDIKQNGFNVPYTELLLHYSSNNIHQKNLLSLMGEVYKALKNLSPIFLREFFIEKNTPYNLRAGSLLKLPLVKGRLYGIDCLQFRASWSWNNLPDMVKTSETFAIFKSRLRDILKHGQIPCNCRLCRDQ